MDSIRKLAFGFMVALGIAAATNYIPGLTDSQGKAFGIFALDIYDDLLHLASAPGPASRAGCPAARRRPSSAPSARSIWRMA